MKTTRLLLTVLVAATVAPCAFPFGTVGHTVIGSLASDRLKAKNSPALTHIRAILGNDDLGAVAVWADWVRLRDNRLTKAQITEANVLFPGNGDWHFVDLPLGLSQYSATAPSAGENDVVHGLNKCIAILENTDATPGHKLHKGALCFIIHLVGDIHQPLHVACGYYRLDPITDHAERVSDPAVVTRDHLPNDRGGNQLIYGEDERHDELHAVWDNDLVLAQVGLKSNTPTAVARVVKALKKGPQPAFATSGDYHTWAEKWATDAIPVAKAAYQGVSLPRAEIDQHDHGQIGKWHLEGFDHDEYVDDHVDEERAQLIKAAGRLADLLEKINWKD